MGLKQRTRADGRWLELLEVCHNYIIIYKSVCLFALVNAQLVIINGHVANYQIIKRRLSEFIRIGFDRVGSNAIS